MKPVIAIRDRAAEPFVGEDLAGLADVATVVYHGFVLAVLDHLMARGLVAGPLTLSDGGLWVGAASFRNPGVDGGTAPGLCYRGIPLVPRPELHADASWSSKVPVNGVEVHSTADLDRLIDRLTGATPTPSGPTARHRPPLSSRGSGPRTSVAPIEQLQTPRSSLES